MFDKLRQSSTTFLDQVFEFVAELQLDVSDLYLDHMALRYKDSRDVDQLVQELSKQGTVLADATVNGRTIYIFKLHDPIIYSDRAISCIELPYPTSHHEYPHDGWEHVEFVLPCDDISNLESIFKQKFSHLTPDILTKYGYALKTPEVDEKLKNPTIVLTKHKGLAIKFHPNSIEKVVTTK